MEISIEVLSFIGSCIALIISLVSIVRARENASENIRLQKEQLELNRKNTELQQVVSELSHKQLENIDKEKELSRKANIEMGLIEQGNCHRLYIANSGPAKARNVNIYFDSDEARNVFVDSEFDEKIPAKFINPGSQVTLMCGISCGDPTHFIVHAQWDNEDETSEDEEFMVSI